MFNFLFTVLKSEVKTTIGKPQNLSVANVTSRTITLTWLAPNVGKDSVTYNYSIFYYDGNTTFVRAIPNIHIYTIENLRK